MLKVLHISTYDYEGAATATYRMHENLLNHGVDSKILVSQKTKHDDNLIEIKRSDKNKKMIDFKNKVAGKLKIYKGKYNFIDKQQYVDVEHDVIIQKLGDFSPNIIVLHWISNFLSLETVYELQKFYNAKVFWNLADMAPLTGGCHFAWECEGYKFNCNPCMAIRWFKSNNLEMYLKYKKKYIDLIPITPISGGSYIHKQIADSYVFSNQKIANMKLGIDVEVFSDLKGIVDKKKKYNLELTNKIIIFFPIYHVKNERKGFKYILEAFKILDKKYENFSSKVLLLTAGHISSNELNTIGNYEILHLGYLSNQNDLAEAYQISDFFLSSSIEDSGPMMVMESMLAGTPVISFDLGISQDLVIHKITGYRARLKDSNDLANGIYEMVRMSKEEYMLASKKCIHDATISHSRQRQYDDFMKMIKDI